MFRFFQVFLVVLILVILYSPTTTRAESSGYITDYLQIEATQKDDKLILDYLVLERFYDPENRHGIFIALPKNQNGVWTDYQVVSAERSSQVICDGGLPQAETFLNCLEYLDQNLAEIDSTPEFMPEKFEQFKEWNELRVRLGDKNINLDEGTYFYKIRITATINTQNSYNFAIVNNWNDPIQSSKFSFNGQTICQDNECEINANTVQLNPGKPIIPPYQKYVNDLWPYAVLMAFGSIFAFYLWYKLARDPKQEKVESPEFESPKIMPWEAQYLLSEGYLGVKNVLLSYILWLNHQKYIKLTPVEKVETNGLIDKLGKMFTKEDKIEIKILKDLPNVLPVVFNETVLAIEEKGMQAGILETKIGPEKTGSALTDYVRKNCSTYYSQLPSSTFTLIVAIGGFFLLFVILPLIIEPLNKGLLIGYSYSWLVYVTLIWTLPQLLFVGVKWGRLNKTGVDMRTSIRRYKYYLEKAEKLKLDFSNNPEDGVQYYLKAVPFAAAFGILDQFQKYIESVALHTEQYNSASLLNTSFHSMTFYASSSSGSGGGGGGGGSSGGGGGW